jgi:hypothetical protein
MFAYDESVDFPLRRLFVVGIPTRGVVWFWTGLRSYGSFLGPILR